MEKEIEAALAEHKINTEAKLRQSEARYRLLAENLQDVIWTMDMNLRFTYVSPSVTRHRGYSVEEAMSLTLEQTLPPDSLEKATDAIAKAMTAVNEMTPEELRSASLVMELENYCKDGSIITVETTLSFLLDSEGKPAGIIGASRDITERKRFEARLQKSETELRKLFRAVEQSKSTVVITDSQGTIEYVNPAFSQITGYTAQEAIGQNPRILKSGQHPPEFYREMWATLTGGDVWQGELVNKKKNGALYWESATISPIKDQTGTITHYLAIKDDVTEQKRATEKLRIRHRQQQILNTLLRIGLDDLSLAEQLDRALQEILSVPWLPLLARGGIFLVGDRPETLALTAQQNLSPSLQTMCALVPFGRCLCGRAAVARRIIFAGCVDEKHENQYDGIMPHGHYNVPILSGPEVLGVIALYLPEGHQKTEDEEAFLYAVGNVLAGAIKRKQAEEESRLKRQQAETLRAATQALSTTLDLPQVFELILSELQKVVPYDSVSVQLLKGNRLEIIGGRGFPNLDEIIGISFDLTADNNPNRRVIATGKPLILHNPGAEYPRFHAGRHAPAHIASWLGVPLLFDDKPIGMIAIDKQEPGFYTEEHAQLTTSFVAQAAIAIENASLFNKTQQARAAALEAQQAAETANKAKSDFLARVSHELRTPLGAILGYTEFFLNGTFGPISGKQREIAAKVLDSTHYLTNLVNDLLDQSQIETGSIKLKIVPFDLREMVNRVEGKMDVLAQGKGFTLTFEIAPGMPASLSGDEQRLQQILVNLVSNAIKFTTEGKVHIRIYHPDAEHWAMQVSDTGIGIPREAQSYIFDPFRQVEDPTIREYAGAGLGLSIVQKLTAMMGGEITVESEPGKGSVFTVLLPLTPLQEKTE